MFETLWNDFLALGALRIIGLIAVVILAVSFLAWLWSSIGCRTRHNFMMKQMQDRRDREIKWEQEMRDFVAEETRRLLVQQKAINDTKGNYNFGEHGLKLE